LCYACMISGDRTSIGREKMAESDYLMYVLITEKRTNQRVFEWRRGTGNLVLGLKVTSAFIEDKLGIPLVLFSPNGQGNGSGMKEPDMKPVGPLEMVSKQDQVNTSELVDRIVKSGGIRIGRNISDGSASG
jgi:hypothetical protein